jgi:hypothetical protein
MSTVLPGRFTAQTDRESFAVFLIGMRINRLLSITSWWPPATTMPRMLRHLLADQEKSGLLGYNSWGGRTTMLASYWRSAEDVQRFASDRDAPHAAAWRAFVKKGGTNGAVGVWHELYTVHRGDFECVYNNMPAFGLGKSVEHVPVGDGTRTSRQRMTWGAGNRASAD